MPDTVLEKKRPDAVNDGRLLHGVQAERALEAGDFHRASELAATLLADQFNYLNAALAIRSLVATEAVDEIANVARRLPAMADLTGWQLRTLSAEAAVRPNLGLAIFLGGAAIGAEPDEADFWVHYSSLLCAANKLAEAQNAAESAIRRNNRLSVAHRLLSAIMALRGDMGRAVEAAERAIELSPADMDHRIHIAGILLNSGNPHRALFHLAPVCARDGSSDLAWRLFSVAFLQAGDVKSALEAAERAASLSPIHIEYRDNLSLNVPLVGGELSLSRPSPHAPQDFVLTENILAKAKREQAGHAQRDAIGFGIAARVIWAIMLRDIRTMYSSSRLSYLWAIFEPCSHVALLYTIFVLVGHTSRPPIGDNMLVFYLSGLFPYLCFSHGTEKAMHVISSNRPLLSIPRITPFDIIVARTSLSIFTDLAVMIVVCAAMSAIGFLDYPAKPFDIVSGCILNWGLVYGFAFSNAVVSSRFDWWEKIWPTLLRIQYFTCGIFYHPTLMPNWAMNYLSWNPLVHVLEYFRQGYFRDYHSHFLDESYLVVWAVGALGVGLVLEASARNQLRQGR